MKKIVALVLAMVMVLGLAATTYAATPVVLMADEVEDMVTTEPMQLNFVPVLEKDTNDDEFDTYSVTMLCNKTFVDAQDETWVKGEDDYDLEFDGVDEFVVVDGTGTYLFAIVEGKKVTYYDDAEKYNDVDMEPVWDAENKVVNLPVMPNAIADMKCETYYATSPLDTEFFWYEEVLYAAAADGTDGAVVFNVDGVAVVAAPVGEALADATRIDSQANSLDEIVGDARVIYSAHNYVVEFDANTYGDDSVKKVYCDFCKEEYGFAYSKGSAVAQFGMYSYFQLLNEDDDGLDLFVSYAAKGAAADKDAATDAEGDKVTSAETFDAGIAMYVGMSVMAAAGSAVVLKKKD